MQFTELDQYLFGENACKLHFAMEYSKMFCSYSSGLRIYDVFMSLWNNQAGELEK